MTIPGLRRRGKPQPVSGVTDLLAESERRQERARAQADVLGSTDGLYGVQSPRCPDPVVFGTWLPDGSLTPGTGSYRECGVHGVKWRGPGSCWLCEPDSCVTAEIQ